MRITLYELFDICSLNDTDIADNTYDFIVNFACHIKRGDCQDSYDKVMRYFATKIELDKFDVDRPTLAHCFINEFIKANLTAFNKFMEDNNREGYRVSDYDLVDEESDLWYDIYFGTFNNLVIGNYSESQYKDLLALLQIYRG